MASNWLFVYLIAILLVIKGNTSTDHSNATLDPTIRESTTSLTTVFMTTNMNATNHLGDEDNRDERSKTALRIGEVVLSVIGICSIFVVVGIYIWSCKTPRKKAKKCVANINDEELMNEPVLSYDYQKL